MSLLTNPALISVIVLCILCLKRINVLLAIIISAIAASNPRLKIIVSLKKFMESNMDPILKSVITKDINATNIYTMGYGGNTGIANLDYTHKVIELK